MESKEVHGAGNKKVVLPFLLHVLFIRLWVVEANILNGCLHSLFRPIQSNNFPLFLLYELDGLEYYLGGPIIAVVMVVVQPQIVQS